MSPLTCHSKSCELWFIHLVFLGFTYKQANQQKIHQRKSSNHHKEQVLSISSKNDHVKGFVVENILI